MSVDGKSPYQPEVIEAVKAAQILGIPELGLKDYRPFYVGNYTALTGNSKFFFEVAMIMGDWFYLHFFIVKNPSE